MTENLPTPLTSKDSDNWLRLRTLILLRWWAILGQATALIVAQRLFGLSLDLGLCSFVIGVSVITNLVASFIYPENKRLSEREIFGIVCYDMLQLGLLLYLTGGLHNPFSILIIGPVIISASALSLRSTVFLGVMSLAIVSVLTTFYLPLRTEDGVVLEMPDMFLFGTWIAIVIAILFLGVYSRWIVSEMESMSAALQATQMALAREQKLTDLGGVVAATAHELGTPLATIKLASAELMADLPDPEQREDARLISEQADRCRDILRSMGRIGKEDLHMREAPITALVDEAAEPHASRGKAIIHDHRALSGTVKDQPIVLRRPDVLHGLRNLIQNAVDFAESTVWIESEWSDKVISVRIMDDGNGYPATVIGRIGEPFVRRRNQSSDHAARPSYEGMGLGLFIAKTLLERSGAELSFANGADSFRGLKSHAQRKGAFVEVRWPRDRLDIGTERSRRALGTNTPVEP